MSHLEHRNKLYAVWSRQSFPPSLHRSYKNKVSPTFFSSCYHYMDNDDDLFVAANAVVRRLGSLPIFQQAKSLSCYLSMPSGEVDTASVVFEVLESGTSNDPIMITLSDSLVKARLSLCQRSWTSMDEWIVWKYTTRTTLCHFPVVYGESKNQMQFGRASPAWEVI